MGELLTNILTWPNSELSSLHGFPPILLFLYFPDWWNEDTVGRGDSGFGAGSSLLRHRTDQSRLSFLIWRMGINVPHRPSHAAGSLAPSGVFPSPSKTSEAHLCPRWSCPPPPPRGLRPVDPGTGWVVRERPTRYTRWQSPAFKCHKLVILLSFGNQQRVANFVFCQRRTFFKIPLSATTILH